MNLTINVNIPEKLISEAATPLAATGGLPTPDDPEPTVHSFLGPPMAMLLFALTRAEIDLTQKKLMSDVQRGYLNTNTNRKMFDIYRDSAATGKNAIDVFDDFIRDNDVLKTLQLAQGVYAQFKKYCSDGGTVNIWDRSCEVKYSQLANIAQTDWQNYP
jgi:hypothetical protein